MGDLLPKTITEDVTDIAPDYLYLKSGFKAGNDSGEFNYILNAMKDNMKNM